MYMEMHICYKICLEICEYPVLFTHVRVSRYHILACAVLVSNFCVKGQSHLPLCLYTNSLWYMHYTAPQQAWNQATQRFHSAYCFLRLPLEKCGNLLGITWISVEMYAEWQQFLSVPFYLSPPRLDLPLSTTSRYSDHSTSLRQQTLEILVFHPPLWSTNFFITYMCVCVCGVSVYRKFHLFYILMHYLVPVTI